MNFKTQNIIICVLSLVLVSLSLTHASSTKKCYRSCGTTKTVPFPFGFSSGCQIQLNCTTNNTITIGEFVVHNIISDAILVNLPAKCGRPLRTLHHLFSQNYAPTSRNSILLQNCSTPVTGCFIPSTGMQTHLEMLDCSSSITSSNNTDSNKNTISCYSEQKNGSLFIDYDNIMRTSCESLISAVTTETFSNTTAVSLEVQVVELGWWLEGTCRCSTDATCTSLTSPVDGKAGYRCRCNEGFAGDGFRAGVGCRKETGCNASGYMSGHCGGRTRAGVLAGGVAAGALLMISIGLVCCFLRHRRHSVSKTENRRNRRLFETKNISIPVYPYKEIEKATDRFSDERRLGTGAYGTVYSGKLSNNDHWVAIKRIKHRDTSSIDQVMNEIKLLSSVNHPNLVRLLGCSVEKDEQILVYEYMPNGTLCQHLHRHRGTGLVWPVRLTIALETAQAIAYLHSAMNPPIYHRDIKSSNILLDCDYKTKVADFGLSRLGLTESSHISTAPQGTPGYLDPHYHQNFHLSDKSDVYSFGVVLAEIITALKVLDFTRVQNEVNLASLAINRIGKGRLNEIIDPFIMQNMDNSTMSSLHKVAELAFRCLAFDSDTRPSMTDVAAELEQITKLNKYECVEDVTAAEKHEMESKGGIKNYSPVSVQESWSSERSSSSPSSNSLLSHSIR